MIQILYSNVNWPASSEQLCKSCLGGGRVRSALTVVLCLCPWYSPCSTCTFDFLPARDRSVVPRSELSTAAADFLFPPDSDPKKIPTLYIPHSPQQESLSFIYPHSSNLLSKPVRNSLSAHSPPSCWAEEIAVRVTTCTQIAGKENMKVRLR
jgi:hypothetical protein